MSLGTVTLSYSDADGSMEYALKVLDYAQGEGTLRFDYRCDDRDEIHEWSGVVRLTRCTNDSRRFAGTATRVQVEKGRKRELTATLSEVELVNDGDALYLDGVWVDDEDPGVINYQLDGRIQLR